MKATTFKLQKVTNPNTGEISNRIAVLFDNAELVKLYPGKDTTVEEKWEQLKKDPEAAKKAVRVIPDGQFGKYCVISRAEDVEEL
jgi:hypothetical protein